MPILFGLFWPFKGRINKIDNNKADITDLDIIMLLLICL